MYAIFFDCNGTTYRLPTNPEELSVTSSQSVEKYNVLKLGQIAVPTYMELKEYSFECEFPSTHYSYVNVKADDKANEKANVKSKAKANVKSKDKSLTEKDDNFKAAKEYLDAFAKWRKQKTPVRFIAGCVNEEGVLNGDRINTLVLIQEMSIKEKAGEEGDKYVSFKLTEYRDFNKTPYYEIKKDNPKVAKGTSDAVNPKKKGYYVVAKGDTLIGISKKCYGNGAKYVDIAAANKGLIKNPALIQPGWKLVIP